MRAHIIIYTMLAASCTHDSKDDNKAFNCEMVGTLYRYYPGRIDTLPINSFNEARAYFDQNQATIHDRIKFEDGVYKYEVKYDSVTLFDMPCFDLTSDSLKCRYVNGDTISFFRSGNTFNIAINGIDLYSSVENYKMRCNCNVRDIVDSIYRSGNYDSLKYFDGRYEWK